MSRAAGRNRALRRGLLHGALIAGSLLFTIPFVWLLSTSSKTQDEMYPLHWVPEIPGAVVRSPYIGLRENARPERPPLVTREDWQRLGAPIRGAITRELEGRAGTLPEFMRTYLGEPDLADAVYARLLQRAPDAVFERDESGAAAWFVERTTDDLAREVFEAVYRRVAFGEVVFHGRDLTIDKPAADEQFQWRVVSGDATLIPRMEGLLKPAQEVAYSFEDESEFVVTAVLPCAIAPDDLKKVIVSNHADRSWHRISSRIEFAGRAYRSEQDAFTGSDKWQDTTWQIESDSDRAMMVKTWLRFGDRESGTFDEPGTMRVTLTYSRAPYLAAATNKYLDNYRTVLRMAPMAMYLKNSLWLAALNVIGQVIGSSLVAYAFARLQWPGRDFYFLVVLATLMMPPQVTMIPVFLIFKYIGWYDTLKPLWVTSFFGHAFYIFLLRQFMLGIPKDLEDSAKIDGCGYLGIYWRVILPLVRPALITVAIFTFLTVWNDFMGPLIYLSDQSRYPLSLGLFALRVFQPNNQTILMAGCVLMTLPVLILFFFAQRYFIQGVTLTGLKG